MIKGENPCGSEQEKENVRRRLEREEQEWRMAGYPVEKAGALDYSYSACLGMCFGPDEDEVPDEFGLYRHNDAVLRKADFGLADKYFALAQEMALRYLNRKFRRILQDAFDTAKYFAWYEYHYSKEPGYREKLERLEKEYEDCCERERQARKRLQESYSLPEEYFKACVEVTAILERASRKELERIPKSLLDFFDRNSDPYYEFIPEEVELKDMKLLPETKGLLAMIYRNYWCTEEERREYDRLLIENNRKYRNLDPLQEEEIAAEIEKLEGLEGLFVD